MKDERTSLFPFLRKFVEGGGYEVVRMGDGHMSSVPMNEAAALVELEQAEKLADLVRRFREWDDLPGRADGPFWMHEADRLLARGE